MARDLKHDLITGLISNPKCIPTWYNYDDVGSTLQHESCKINRDYYFSSSQLSVLEQSIQDIIPRNSYALTLVDLGSGNCSKTRIVIDELLKRQKTLTFYPVDISGEFLMKAAKVLSEEYGDSLLIKPISADYNQGIEELRLVEGPKLILWFGTIVNLPYEDQVNTLRRISTIMTERCQLVFSADITQNRESIMKAYHDDAGAKQMFITHGIARLNNDEGSQIDLTKFSFEVDFISNNDPDYMSYVIAYIKAKEDIRYKIPGLGIDLLMNAGEILYFHEGAGYSCKYTMEQLTNIVGKAGLRLTGNWKDNEEHAVLCRCIND